MTAPCTIRPAAVADQAAVVAAYLASRAAAFPAIPRSIHPDHDVLRHFRDDVWPTHEIWVPEVDGTVVGLLVLDRGQELEHLYLAPGHTGRGIGAALVDQAKQRRPRGLELWAFASNTGARRFYERHGFVAIAFTDGSRNEEGEPDVRYRWPGR